MVCQQEYWNALRCRGTHRGSKLTTFGSSRLTTCGRAVGHPVGSPKVKKTVGRNPFRVPPLFLRDTLHGPVARPLAGGFTMVHNKCRVSRPSFYSGLGTRPTRKFTCPLTLRSAACCWSRTSRLRLCPTRRPIPRRRRRCGCRPAPVSRSGSPENRPNRG